uniref:O-antigen ligase family protein n=1 Tax=Thaumasiovibrio occultus TaxID=1891184 RepID=UPI000B358F66|nr:O-antigen ligase family protein [Thaumasiovibrio occultus]
MTFKLDSLSFYASCIFIIALGLAAKGYNWGGFILILASIAQIWTNKPALSNPAKFIAATLLFYYTTFILSYFYHGEEASTLDQSSRSILVIPILFSLVATRINIKNFYYSIGICGIFLGAYAAYHVYIVGLPRAFYLSGFMPIQHGGIAMTIGLLSLIGYFELKRTNSTARYLNLVGTLAGISGSLLSGSRGCWFALLLLPIIVLIYKELFTKKNMGIVFIIATLFSLSLLAPTNPIRERVEQAGSDIQQIQSDQMNNSVGLRLVLWKSSIYSIVEKPLLGWGNEGRKENVKRQVDDKIIPDYGDHVYYHAHNQYLETTVIRGIVGLMGLLSVMVAPLIIFWKTYSSDYNKALPLMGATHVLASGSYFMTQAFLGHNSGSIFYFAMLAILLGLSLNIWRTNRL